ncbi:hypothetical protein [Cellulomonas composti]|uniref:Uncharacterized protein n=1 Tax=Cellulomonas composti TaxID=266130 RepID=A0A511JD43_9CELL|nr:hypothetical protein [Cellulomonas composti]GEL95895.1 hypothetical protein CCO02nite_25530 [Cellulomonas composti]
MPPSASARTAAHTPAHPGAPFVVVTPLGRAAVTSDELCHVCRRARITPAGALACELCLAVDAALGARFRTDLFTPLDTRGTDDVLYHRLWGDGDESRHARLVAEHRAGLEAMRALAEAEGLRYLVVTSPHAPRHTSFVDWPRWRRRFPPSLDASVRAYRTYLTLVHAWALEVEPRLLEPGWLEHVVRVTPWRCD